jgi:hypothetical protein
MSIKQILKIESNKRLQYHLNLYKSLLNGDIYKYGILLKNFFVKRIELKWDNILIQKFYKLKDSINPRKPIIIIHLPYHKHSEDIVLIELKDFIEMFKFYTERGEANGVSGDNSTTNSTTIQEQSINNV